MRLSATISPTLCPVSHGKSYWAELLPRQSIAKVPAAISVGEAIPRTVHLYRLPPRIVEYAPQYRDYEYILVGDDILIIDPRTHRIIAVIPA